MYCPYCGEEAKMKEVKHAADLTMIRYYHCMGNARHRFITRECYESVFSVAKRRTRIFAETVRCRIALYDRNRNIYLSWKDGIKALMQRYGLSKSGVCLARKAYEEELGLKTPPRNLPIKRDYHDHTSIQAQRAQGQNLA